MVHPFNTFCFAELHTPDVARAARFYGEVLGWKAAHITGDFHLFQVDGKDVIGLRRTNGADRLVGYVKVDSVDRMMARAEELGARVDTPPSDTPGVAGTCVLSDPEGATFGLWEERGHAGAAVQDQNGSMWWIELAARDIVDARHFYSRLFGWDWRETPKYEISERSYTVFTVPDCAVAGALQYHPDWGVTPHWTVFIHVADWAATCARAESAGGSLIFWRDVPHTGRLGVIQDPGCATFTVMMTLGAP
jgi:predicted enzyme related to lactoylglutathione lyase